MIATTSEAAVTEACSLLLAFVDKRVSADEFAAGFGDVYHEFALDGHERDSAQQVDVHRSLDIEILRVVQEVVDQLIPTGAEVAAYVANGRIKIEDLRERVIEAVARVALFTVRR